MNQEKIDKDEVQRYLPTARRAVVEMIELAEAAGLEKDTPRISDSVGISEDRWKELNIIAQMFQYLPQSISLALVGVQQSSLPEMEKVCLAYLFGRHADNK